MKRNLELKLKDNGKIIDIFKGNDFNDLDKHMKKLKKKYE